MTDSPRRLAYLFSRYPVRSQTFTDNEMLGLEARGWELTAASIQPPVESFRQPNLASLKAPVLYSPPSAVLDRLREGAVREGWWPATMIARHEAAYGPSFKSSERARNALWFAGELRRREITHVHVPFANRALHTALFLREITGITLSFTTHGQDFMVDLGSDALLAEMARASEFVVAVCDYSRELLRRACPDSADRIVRIYNGLDPAAFPFSPLPERSGPLRILSVGRLIEFKGFHRLIEAVAIARDRGTVFHLDIVGEGPWREHLDALIRSLALVEHVRLRGPLSSGEVRGLLADCDLFALGSLVDGRGASDLLPTVITEAMLRGRAVLGTRVAGLPEMIEDGKTGRLVGSDDARALAEALLAMNRPTLRAWGEAGRQRAETHFVRDGTLPQLENRFYGALQSGTGSRKISQPVLRSVASPSPGVAFFDLALPGRAEWLAGEWPGLVEKGCAVVASAAGSSKDNLVRAATVLSDCVWIPDGTVLEAEWCQRTAWRGRLEVLRAEWSTAIEGESFFPAARRAVWLAAWCGKQDVRYLYAPGGAEALVAHLVSLLLGLPMAVALESNPPFSGDLLRKLAAGAARISDAGGRIAGTSDTILHGSEPEVCRVGFVRWKRPAKPVAPDERARRLGVFLDDPPQWSRTSPA